MGDNSIFSVFSNIRVITKLPNSEQSYKGKVKAHNYINRQNQSTTGKLWKPLIICAFENSPSIPSFLVTKIVYIGYGQLKKWLLFLLPFHSCAPCIFISYCYLCQCQAVWYYYMPVPTKYHWNISFQKNVHRNMLLKMPEM